MECGVECGEAAPLHEGGCSMGEAIACLLERATGKPEALRLTALGLLLMPAVARQELALVGRGAEAEAEAGRVMDVGVAGVLLVVVVEARSSAYAASAPPAAATIIMQRDWDFDGADCGLG